MTTQELFTLLDKGFTKEEILKIVDEKDDVKENEGEVIENNNGNQEGNSVSENETTTALMKLVEETNAQNKKLAETLERIQSDNAKKDSQEVKKNSSADDVIINFVQTM